MLLQILTLTILAVSTAPHLSFCSAATTTSNVIPSPTVDLGYATYVGTPHPISINASTPNPNENSTTFFGIRYAAPPTGSLRFVAPQPPETTQGAQAADVQPPECFQGLTGANLTNPFSGLTKRQSGTSEDCLFLSVYVPGASGVLPPPNSLPVLVWIHGGGYIAGNEATANGTDLIHDAEGGVVIVTIQYRLGIFGFLPGSEVKNGGGALNAGLRDQVFALEWVQEHISKFGGDPTRVTIWGESAGAGSVLQHVIMNDGNTRPPLFRAALTSSTFLPSQYKFDDIVPERLYAEVVAGTDCTDASSTFACLQSAPTSTLASLDSSLNGEGFVGTFVFVPVIDGELIVTSPTEILQRGRVNGDVILSVTNAFEGTVFVSDASGSNAASNTTLYAQQLFPFLSDEQSITVAKLYSTAADDALDQSIGIMGESIFICPTYLLMKAFEKAKKNAWKGEFAIPPAFHGNDIAYYFTDTTPPFPNPAFQQAFSGSFLSTALNLDPNNKVNGSSITPEWPTWNALGTGTEMLFNSTDGNSGEPVVHTIQTDSSLLERCAFWWSVANVTGQ